MDIEQQRPGGVGRIGRVYLTARQAPQQETVDRPERELAGLGSRPHAVHIVQEPRDLRAGKIGIQPEPGLCRHRGLQAIVLLRLAIIGRSPVLPDNRVVDWPTCFSIPDDSRFTLVRDADRRYAGGIHAGPVHGSAGYRSHGRPDRLGIVLDPARSRVDLRKLLLFACNDVRVLVVDDGTAAAGALVNCKQKCPFHDSSDPAVNIGCLTSIRRPASCGQGCAP